MKRIWELIAEVLRLSNQKLEQSMPVEIHADERIGYDINRKSAGKSGLRNENFRNRRFDDVSANETVFENCDFSYSIFVRGYFHRTKFLNCSFVGCRFYDCNFREARFNSSDFRYCSFQNTLVPAAEIISNLPPQPNLRRDVLQVLKVNALQVGDIEGSRRFTDEEIKATEVHLKMALKGEGHYYKEKYPSTYDKFILLIQLASHKASGFFWGHGERPYKLIMSLLVIILLMTLINALSYPLSLSLDAAGYFANSLENSVDTFLGVKNSVTDGGFLLVNYFLVILRYIYIGLFISVLAKYVSFR